MNFTEAIKAMKDGEKIARVEWPYDQYLTLVLMSEEGDMDSVDDYVANKIGVIKPTVATRIDHYENQSVKQASWMATEDDIQGEWRLWVQHH